MKPRPPLTRSHSNRVIAGICAGLADHLNLPVRWVRVGLVLATFIGGAGAVLYIFLLCTVPDVDESPQIPPLKRWLTRPSTESPSADILPQPARTTPHVQKTVSPGQSGNATPRPFPVVEIL